MFVWKTALFLLLVVCGSVADDSCPGLPMCFCNKDKTSVNCEGKHLTDVPADIPVTVEKLYLGYNVISVVKTDAFASLTKLEKIWLKNNKISEIHPYAFGNLSNLQTIDLSGNLLSNVGDDAFSGMKRLATLFLNNNQIKNISERAFNETGSVKSIYLQSNKLMTVPSLGNMPYLEKIILQANLITDAMFPSSYSNSTTLRYIVLSQNKIAGMDDTTFRALANTSISSLYISSNSITQITPGVFKPFASIVSLKLGSNPLSGPALKVAIESLQGKSMVSLDLSDLHLNGILLADTFALLSNTSITTLDMKLNKISTLPSNVFVGLDKVMHLDLSSCKIQQTDVHAFNGLDKLTILNLQKNMLVEIPSNLPVTLEKLYLDDNQITAIQSKVFSNNGRLVELRIQYNQVLTLMQDSFVGLSRLSKLSLYYNNIATLPGKVFNPLVKLTTLSLAHNNLAAIQQSAQRFSSQSLLVNLNLADNMCSYLPPDFFTDLTSLKYLHLERNLLGNLLSGDYGGRLFQGLRNLQELYLMSNEIKNLPVPALHDLTSLALLNVSNNKLSGWADHFFQSTHKLRLVDMSTNLIATLREDNIDQLPSTVTGLNLTGNPFVCDCDLRWFRDWMNRTNTYLANNSSYTCHGPEQWKNKALLSFDRTKIDCTVYTWWEIAIGCAVGAVVVLIIVIIAYRKRWWIKLFIYKRTRKGKPRRRKAADGHANYGAIGDPDPEAANTKFDAYISCADEDFQWVIDHLLPDVDNGERDQDTKFGGEFALYFRPRDEQIGRSYAGNIYENMDVSSKVIVVLSKNFLKDPMNLFELDLAVDLMYKKKLDEIILIHIQQGLPQEKIPKHLLHTMQRNVLLEWADNMDARDLMKRRLIESLGKNDPAAERDAE